MSIPRNHWTGVEVNLLTRLDQLGAGRLSEIIPARRMEPVSEDVSSDPEPDGETELNRDSRPKGGERLDARRCRTRTAGARMGTRKGGDAALAT
jgi:hypothetical protein